MRWECVDTAQRLRAQWIENRVSLHTGEMSDAGNLVRIVNTVQPDETYNLAAISHVQASFETPTNALEVNSKGVLNLLEAIRILDLREKTRLYQASSSEMFGSASAPQNEDTPFHPCSPYGVAKLAAYWLVRTYHDAYGLHASNGILFNHESPLRGEDFVTRKIARRVAEIKAGLVEDLTLGNLDAVRDWGYAGDYVRGIQAGTWPQFYFRYALQFIRAGGSLRHAAKPCNSGTDYEGACGKGKKFGLACLGYGQGAA